MGPMAPPRAVNHRVGVRRSIGDISSRAVTTSVHKRLIGEAAQRQLQAWPVHR
jgi:hypothetical protein